MSIVETPENYLSNVGSKSDMIKVHISSVKSSSTFFLVKYMQYIIDSIVLKRRLMLKWYIPGSNTSIFLKRNCDNIFSEKLVNKLHYWIENSPRVIQSPNVSY